jgi:hypothetical protein
VVVAVETAAAFTEKLALLDPAATVMDDGIVIAATGVPSLSATFAPVLDAGCVRVTVQVEVPGVRTVAGVHTSAWITGTGGRSDSKKLAELPLRLATTIAVAAALTVPAFNVNAALVAPAETVTDDGTVTFAELAASPKDTLVAVEGAAAKVTVQAAVVPVTSDAGLHASLVTASA